MAVPTYDELLRRNGIKHSVMGQTFEEKELKEFSHKLDTWERLARCLELSSADINSINKQPGDEEGKIDRMLVCWKQRRGSMAMYEQMAKALLEIGRTDLAEEVISLRKSSMKNEGIKAGTEISLVSPPSQGSDHGIEDMSPLRAAMSPASIILADPAQKLRELEEDFFELVMFVEAALKQNNVEIAGIIRKFTMLPQSIKRQQQTDEKYRKIRRRILHSTTIKELFDNLTDLKHWNYMTPDILYTIVQNVNIDSIHEEIDKYRDKLAAFKSTTRLGDLLAIDGTLLDVPDYCIELSLKVEGWEDKTIEQAEKAVIKIMHRIIHNRRIPLGWKDVTRGCLTLTFILMESVIIAAENIPEILKQEGVLSVHFDGDVLYNVKDTEQKHKDYHRVKAPDKELYI